MRAFTGIWTPGMISQMLQKKMKQEQRQQERRELEAVRPDRLHDDAVLDEVDDRLGDVLRAGGHERLLAAATRYIRPNAKAAEIHIRRTTLLTANAPLPNRVGHSTTWEIGGKSNPRITSR